MSNAPADSLDDNARAHIAHLSDDDYHRVLASQRRRLLLQELVTWSSPLSRRGVAKMMAEQIAGAETSATDVDRIDNSLHHVHLPLMVQFGVLEYDTTAEQIIW